MNGCRPFHELLSEALDAPLGREDQARLEAHLADCGACRAYARDPQAVRAAVKGVDEVEPPLGFVPRVMAHVRAEVAPKPGFWQRLRPFLLKPQFQVATLLLVGVTSALLIRSRSGLKDSDVLQEFRKASPSDRAVPASPAPESPAAPSPAPAAPGAEAPSAPHPLQDAEELGRARLPKASEEKAKSRKDADAFAPPPPAQALGATGRVVAPAATPAPAASPTPAPAPPAHAEPAAEAKAAAGWAEPPKAAKPAGGAAPGASNTAAAPARAESARDTRQASLDDAGARSRKAEGGLAKEQVGKRDAPDRDQEKQEEDAVPAVFLLWEPEDPEAALALATREVERLGGSVDRGGRRQQQVPRSLTGRLPAHQLPQLQARLARHGAVRPGAGQQQQAPRSGSVVFLLRW